MRVARLVPVVLACSFLAARPVRAEEGPPAQAPNVLTLTQSARTKRAAGDLAGASSDLARAIELAPRSASLLRERAECRAALGDVPGTVADLKRAAALSPQDYPLDLAVWRQAVDAARAAGRAKEPDLLLIQAEVAAIRGKPFKADVASGTQTPKEFGDAVATAIDEEMPRDRQGDIQAGLRRLGLVPDGFDLKREVTGALMSQAAAYYDPKQKKFFHLFAGMSPEMVEATAAHELVHALQDQHFDLTAWFAAHDKAGDGGVRNDDRTLALRCVVEGEATFVQTVWQLEHLMRQPREQALAASRAAMHAAAAMEIEQLVRFARSQSAAKPAGSDVTKSIEAMGSIQPYVLVPLFAAYMDGANLVSAVNASEGGWAKVDRLYADPPTTSEQCLHPEKFAGTRDLPSPIGVPDVPGIAAAGWRSVDTAVHGELYLRVLLARHGASAPAARTAAAGWDGDQYRAWRSADGRTAIVLATTWDTVRDAQEFFDAYRATLPKKYVQLAEEAGSDLSALRYTYGEESLGTGALVLSGREVYAVEGFGVELRTQTTAALAAMKIAHAD